MVICETIAVKAIVYKGRKSKTAVIHKNKT